MKTDNKKTGRIYQLVNMVTGEKYVGATLQTLTKRNYDRKKHYNEWLKGKTDNTDTHKLYSNIFEYDWECFRCELIKEVEVTNRTELYKIEGDYIRQYDTYNNGLNGRIEGRDVKEWYENNKDKINKYAEEYRENNKEKINKYAEEYRKKNKETIKTRNKKYYEKNREKRLEKKISKVVCSCGRIISYSNISVHKKSKVHKEALRAKV